MFYKERPGIAVYIAMVIVTIVVYFALPFGIAKAQDTTELIGFVNGCIGPLFYDISSSQPKVYFYFDVNQSDINGFSDFVNMDRLSGSYESLSGDLDPYLMLIDESGNILAENDDISPTDVNSEIEFKIYAPGRYYIVATAYSGAGRFVLTSGDGCGAGGGDVEFGCSEIRVTNSFPDHNTPDWSGSVGFDGLAGQTVQVTVRRLSSNLLPYLELHEPDSAPNATYYYSTNAGSSRTASIRVTLRYDGWYQIKTFGYNGTIGRYSLSCKLIR